MKRVFSYTVNSTPSTFVYTTREKAIRAAKRAFGQDSSVRSLVKARGTNFNEELSLGDMGALRALVYVEEFLVK